MQSELKINVRYGRYARPLDARLQPLDGLEPSTKRGELISVTSSEIGVAARAAYLHRFTAKACQDCASDREVDKSLTATSDADLSVITSAAVLAEVIHPHVDAAAISGHSHDCC
ncbi:hypothetical protein [Streptomyces sp. Ncost-T10-10d]|uniref:hypothetical protein n=1 Tax=Streptomyces sp. Ncost-T10-10d TaxID=1839774 RepID=UPI00081E0FF4|nr:hypothetical protein [Streptomyces sp. Ncost-T10-10d]SCF89035.1 hypothetical protein GA0115254_1216153 [Streptomyces sp. Ncost-T10-10d]